MAADSNSTARILIVEDEQHVADLYRGILEQDGHTVETFQRGKDALARLSQQDFDLIILDINLQRGIDGFAVLQQFRERNKTARVIIISSHGSWSDINKGFNLLADNYLVKPIEVPIFRARIRNELRQVRRTKPRIKALQYGPLTITVSEQTEQCLLRIGNSEMAITQSDELALYLFQHAGEVLTYENIISAVWKESVSETQITRLRVYIKRIRENIRQFLDFHKSAQPDPETLIQSAFGVGYKVQAPDGTHELQGNSNAH